MTCKVRGQKFRVAEANRASFHSAATALAHLQLQRFRPRTITAYPLARCHSICAKICARVGWTNKKSYFIVLGRSSTTRLRNSSRKWCSTYWKFSAIAIELSRMGPYRFISLSIMKCFRVGDRSRHTAGTGISLSIRTTERRETAAPRGGAQEDHSACTRSRRCAGQSNQLA
ncbi:MAG: hypothetical protein JWQ49_5521 [Edaphobacter sp.]|nr:hypothetical protein [Edaphobacter sp.]